MYMTVKDASLKFNISKRRVQALCKQGRFDGAIIKNGAWLIPKNAVKPDDARKKISLQNQISIFDTFIFDEKISLDEVCNILSISKATAQNWIRLKKLAPLNDKLQFSQNYILSLQNEIVSGENHSLKSRRNKKMVHGKLLYKDYIAKCENKICIEEILNSADTLSEVDLRLILANFAVQFYYQAFENRIVSGKVIFDFLKNADKNLIFHTLVSDLIGANYINEDDFSHLNSFFEKTLIFDKGEDTLGFTYISLKDIGKRKNSGMYYTPKETVTTLVSNIAETKDLSKNTFFDPCCGTGNFFINLMSYGVNSSQIYGQDIDFISVQLARINIFLLCPDAKLETLYSNIKVCDTLKDTSNKKFDVVLGNPPWGADFSKEDLEYFSKNYDTAKSKNADSCDLFIEKSISHLNENGILSFVLPEAVLNVNSHSFVREIIIKNCSFKFVCYLGNAFLKVQCPSIILGLSLDFLGETKGCKISTKNESYILSENRAFDKNGFSFNVSDNENECLNKIESLENAVYLKGNAKFALGIVTGDNKGFISNEKTKNNEVILKGSDILRYGIKDTNNYIVFTPEKFQQVAKGEIYRTNEKLLYRFICEVPVFAYDNKGTLSLNSCNIVIPTIQDVNIKYILAILNSSVCAYFITKKFKSIKLLRSHIESFPIPNATKSVQEEIVILVDKIMEEGSDKKAIYQELDKIIMNLYCLNKNQIETISASLKGKNDFLI